MYLLMLYIYTDYIVTRVGQNAFIFKHNTKQRYPTNDPNRVFRLNETRNEFSLPSVKCRTHKLGIISRISFYFARISS